MKTYILIAVSFVAKIGAAAGALPFPNPDLSTKNWHSSPGAAIESRIFGMIEWDKMPLIKIGTTEQELRAISPLLSPFKKVDALIYSMSPSGVCYEIELLIDSGKVTDISYRASEDRNIGRFFLDKHKLSSAAPTIKDGNNPEGSMSGESSK